MLMRPLLIAALLLAFAGNNVAFGAKGTACITKGSYCSCHYCKCEHAYVYCKGYGELINGISDTNLA